MPREKYQRPKVYAAGARWRAEYREYFIGPDGKESSRHKAKTWLRAAFSKSKAQAECDKFLRELQQGGPKADGSMTTRAFWDEIYYPLRTRRWEWNTRRSATSLWKLHIEPAFGKIALKDIGKSQIELHLGKLSDSGLGSGMVKGVLVRLRSILEEAVDNDFIPKNPARKIEIPPCKPKGVVRSMSESEVRKLWDGTEGRDYIVWRVLVLTGARIGEALALRRDDIGAELRIDESAVNGGVKCPKNRKTRYAPLADSLRGELDKWLATHAYDLVFPNLHGTIYRRSDEHIEEILKRGRATGIPDLTFKMCRTTFSTLFQGDEGDRTSIMGHHSTEFTLLHYRKGVAERGKSSVEELDRRIRKVVEIKKAG